MSNAWKTKDISLPYWIGEICLFRKLFTVSTLNIDFINHKSQSLNTIIPELIKEHENTGPETDAKEFEFGFLLYSIPLKEGHKDFWIEDNQIKYIVKTYNRYYVNIKGSFDEYIKGFSSKTRSTLKRKINKFEKISGGTIDWRTYSTPTEMAEFHKVARKISKETYQEKHLNVGLPDDEDFKADMIERAKSNTVNGYLLYLDGKAISYLYSPIDQGRFIYAYLGYLPETSKLSPGTVLFLKALEQIFDSGSGKIFDFTEGESEQKKMFSTNHVYCGNLICLENTPTNYFWLMLNKVTNRISKYLGDFFDKLGLKKTIRKLLRH
ncbi:GNAT family N-acetyltransferase [Paremcibacter congregatus]|uniref:GNAT family N-acetyltransferase n=1 Tax=Paremcibacter congregatus TaxID=2043170 RepID=A0A2G4YMZ1_9PROT|nr:GNAT family N-acetyltransferase [Paremcibacter congregatus]PHZ83675.1 GNAT family N-acetyltransferase [Paremcibacter congregatus]QDE27378.1 GNAT family N-acetyltransferase [Paremcibacter congregatus]